MAQTRIIKITDITEYTFDWFLLNKNAAVLSMGSAIATDIPTMAVKNPIIIIIPAELTVFHQIPLPPGKTKNVIQAIPYLLEESLIDPPENYHFSMAPSHSAVMTVVSIKKQDLDMLISPWLSNHAQIISLVPEILTLPYTDHEMTVIVEKESVKMRVFSDFGFMCDLANLPLMLDHSRLVLSHMPEKSIVYIGEEEIDKKQFSNLEPCSFHRSDSLPHLQATYAAQAASFNLLPENLKTQHKSTQKILSYCKILSIFMLMIFLGNMGMETIQLTREKDALSKKVSSIYKNIFPDSLQVTSPKLRIERKLQEIAAENNQSLTLLLFEKISATLEKNTNITLENMLFDNNKMSLSFYTSSADKYNELLNDLTSAGLITIENNLHQQDGRFFATITLEYKA